MFSALTEMERLAEHMKNTRQKAFDFSVFDNIGDVIQKSVDILRVLVKSDANSEKLDISSTSLKREHSLVERFDKNKTIQLRDFIYRITDSIGMSMDCIAKREQTKICHMMMIEKKRKEDAFKRPNPKFECTICGIKLTTKEVLNKHIRSHSDNEEIRCPYQCLTCGKRFANIGNLKRHENIHLSDNDPAKKELQCDICGKFIFDRYAMEYHKQSHLDDNDPEQAKIKRPFPCDVCGMRFRRPAGLREHMTLHTGNFPFKCDKCNKGFYHKGPFMIHLDQHEKGTIRLVNNNKWTVMCNLCPRRFKQKCNLIVHLKRHENGTVGSSDDEGDIPCSMESYECNVCGKQYTAQATLKVHMLSHLEGEENQKPFKCEVCEKRFALKTVLKKHKRTHVAQDDPLIQKKVWKCEVCDKEYLKAETLIAHRLTHKGLAKSECKICGKKYTADSTLKIHMLSHLEDEQKKKPLKCDQCDKRFSMSSHLITHKLRHLPLDDPRRKVDTRRWKCDECGKEFKKSESLIRHRLFHMDSNDAEVIQKLRPFECNLCNQKLSNSRSLRQHMNLHTGAIKCEICKTGFNNEEILSRHMDCHRKGTAHIRRTKCCPLCPRRFKKKCELDVHLKRHNDGTVGDSTDEDESDEEGANVHQCDVCGIKYFHLRTLQQHIRKKHRAQTCKSNKEEKGARVLVNNSDISEYCSDSEYSESSEGTSDEEEKESEDEAIPSTICV